MAADKMPQSKTNWSKFKILSAAIVVLLLMAMSSYLTYKLAPKEIIVKTVTEDGTVSLNGDGKLSVGQEDKIISIKGERIENKQISYAEKEQDISTGQLEQTDVEIRKPIAKSVYVKIRDTTHEIPVTVQENYKFERGKLIIEEMSELTLKITAPKAKYELGLGYNSHKEPAALIAGPLYKDTSWWTYIDARTQTVGIKIPLK